MLDRITSQKNNTLWTLFHLALGLISTTTPLAIISWFYLILLSYAPRALKKLKINDYFHLITLICYLISTEFLARLSDAAPLLPYEIGKYLSIAIFTLAIFFRKLQSKIGLAMVLCLLPATLFDLSGNVNFNRIIFNLFGSLSLALGVAALYQVNITKVELDKILHLIWLATLAGLSYVLIKTPDLDTIEFSLASQTETTGGYASNQVSTLMGLGMFLSFYAVIYRINFSGYRLLDIGIMLLFGFQGLLSFSRGGMIVGGIGMAIVYSYSVLSGNSVRKGRVILMGIVAFFGAYIIFQTVNSITGGNLLLRYQGETRGTLAGSKEKSLDVLTTGRLSVAQDDLALWRENFLFGVGCGASQYLRSNTYGYSSHTELSRLLSEHGLLGLTYSILLLLAFFKSRSAIKDPIAKAGTLALFIVAVLTTFHAAMRTYLPSLLIGLSMLKIVSNSTYRNPVIK